MLVDKNIFNWRPPYESNLCVRKYALCERRELYTDGESMLPTEVLNIFMQNPNFP